MDQGEIPNSFAPSGGWYRFVHRFVPSIEPGILHAFTGSILFHSGAVLVLAMLMTEPALLERSEASLVFSLPETSESVGEVTLVVSDESWVSDPAVPVDLEPLEDPVPIAPNFPLEFDISAIAAGDGESGAMSESVAASSWMLDEGDGDGGNQGESAVSGGGGVAGEEQNDEVASVPQGSGAEFFGVQGSGNRFVYVVDCSRSMFGEKWNRVRQELIRSLDELQPEQSFYIILFDGQSHPMFGPSDYAKDMLPATTDNIARARRWVSGYQLGANTSPLASVTHAMKLKPHAVFLLTDGEFADSTAQWLRDHNRIMRIDEKPRIRTPVHTIGIFNKKSQRLLKRIARENNGQFQFIPETFP
jgi:hypothetical protein